MTTKGRVNLKGICKKFGDFIALDHIDLDIQPVEFFALLGPSGSGKTTTLRMIAGLDTPNEGTIEIDMIEGYKIPYFLILNRFSMLDTYQGMVIVYLTFSLPFAIWLLVSYMEDIPLEMEEAAFLDKASRLQTLWHIIIPQVRGGISVTIIFVFLNAWNEFLFAVQLGGNTVRPVTVAMYNFVSVEQTLWAKLSAAALIAMLPVVIIGIVAQKQIVKGLTVGAVKGGGRR